MLTGNRDSTVPARAAVSNAMDTLLESMYWPATLAVGQCHTRIHDDNDGRADAEHALSIILAADGDVHVIAGAGQPLRFRCALGGGMSPRVRAALLVLAEAVRRDNEAIVQAGSRTPGNTRVTSPDEPRQMAMEERERG